MLRGILSTRFGKQDPATAGSHQAAGQSGPDHLAQGIMIVAGDPTVERDLARGKERLLVKHLGYWFYLPGLRGRLLDLTQQIAGNLPAGQGHQQPHPRPEQSAAPFRRRIGQGMVKGRGYRYFQVGH